MSQDELTLETSILNLMNAPKKRISWRRAHEKQQPWDIGRKKKKRIVLQPVVVNYSTEQEKNKMLESIKDYRKAAPKEITPEQYNLFG